MPGRFPLLVDENVEDLLVWAAKHGRVLLACNKGIHRNATRWLTQKEGRFSRSAKRGGSFKT